MWRSAVQVCLGLPLISLGGLAQLARAPALQAGGQRFESVILHSVCENADRTVSKDFKLKTELYDSINSQFTAESMSYVTLV